MRFKLNGLHVWLFILFLGCDPAEDKSIQGIKITVFTQKINDDPQSKFPDIFKELLRPITPGLNCDKNTIFLPINENNGLIVERIDYQGAKNTIKIKPDITSFYGKAASDNTNRIDRIINSEFKNYQLETIFTKPNQSFIASKLKNFSDRIAAICDNCHDSLITINNMKLPVFTDPGKLKNYIAKIACKSNVNIEFAVLYNIKLDTLVNSAQADPYSNFKKKGDYAFNQAKYRFALKYYDSALQVRPSDLYILDRIKECKERLKGITNPSNCEKNAINIKLALSSISWDHVCDKYQIYFTNVVTKKVKRIDLNDNSIPIQDLELEPRTPFIIQVKGYCMNGKLCAHSSKSFTTDNRGNELNPKCLEN